jgi:hypothetical protein
MDVRPHLLYHDHDNTKFVFFLYKTMDHIEKYSPYKLEFDYFSFVYSDRCCEVWYIQEMFDIKFPIWVCFVYHSLTGFCVRKSITTKCKKRNHKNKLTSINPGFNFRVYNYNFPVIKILQHPDYPFQLYKVAMSLDPQLAYVYYQRNLIFDQLYSVDLLYLVFSHGHSFKEKLITNDCDPINFSSEFLTAKKEGSRSITGIAALYCIWWYNLLDVQGKRMIKQGFKREIIDKFNAFKSMTNTIYNITIFYFQSNNIQVYSTSNPLMFSNTLNRIHEENFHKSIQTLPLFRNLLALPAPLTSTDISIADFHRELIDQYPDRFPLNISNLQKKNQKILIIKS